jgi:hypothetical protein
MGSKNLEVPDPPFVFEDGEGNSMIITPDKDKQGKITFTVSTSGTLILDNEGLIDLEQFIRVSARWLSRVQKEQEKLQKQIAQLEEKLSFLKGS